MLWGVKTGVLCDASELVGPCQDGVLCSHGGSLDAAHFEMAMRQQLRQYAGRRLSDYLAHGCSGEAERTQARARRLRTTKPGSRMRRTHAVREGGRWRILRSHHRLLETDTGTPRYNEV